ncbi:MAG: hypothetical protein QNJ72_30885 [Pleurocapsa sp. MO_226.B13]|nr:hypothetical protein [Pleurocapsa sp. MO_226.B13]
MADNVTKRLRYFTNQFMEEPDFTDEQNYHLDRRHRHNRLLHSPGIAEGLEVEKTDAKEVKVTPGTAIDLEGQEIVQSEESLLDLSDSTNYPPNSEVYITIRYNEELRPEDRQSPDRENTETRITEKPSIEASTETPPTGGTVIRLARFTLDAIGNVPGTVGDQFDNGVRQGVGSVLADNAVSISKLKKELRKDESATLGAAGTHNVMAFETSRSQPNSAFLLVYAYSTTDGARFTWEQAYVTVGDSMQHIVTFRNPLGNTIEIFYKIYAVLES